MEIDTKKTSTFSAGIFGLILLPLGFMWAINQAFQLNIEYTFLNWLAFAYMQLFTQLVIKASTIHTLQQKSRLYVCYYCVYIYVYMKYDNTAKFTFDYTWRDSDDNLVSRTRHTTADETLGEVLNAFELFLRGAGFHFDGHLEFVDENNNPTNTSYADVNQPEFQNQQLEFDFVKELFTDLENFDKDTDIDLDDKKSS